MISEKGINVTKKDDIVITDEFSFIFAIN